MRSTTEGGQSRHAGVGQRAPGPARLLGRRAFTMTIAALSTDNVVVASADAAGSVFVAAFMVINGSDMLRTGIPDLLDRSAGKSVRDTVDRVLAGSAGDFQRLDRVRSRRSGRVVVVEIVLSFEPGLTIAEVNRRIAALKQSMANEIEHADISILTTGAAIA